MIKKLPIILILILAFSMRLFNLSDHPPGLNWDEVSEGYNAYSILKTGTDEWGQVPVTNFRAYGDYPTTFYLYTLVPIEAIFGLNEFSIRLPSAIFGSLLVIVIYLLAKRISKKENLALLSAFLMTISPWNLMLSRQTIQAIPALFLVGLGLLLWLKAATEKKIWFLPATVAFGLSAFAYHNTRILAPVILVILLILYRKAVLVNKKILVGILITAAIFFIPTILSVFSSEGSARATWVGILDQGAINRINESRGVSTLPGPLPRLVSNKITYFIASSAINYLRYFSPQFLGFSGGTQYQFSVPNFGVLYPIELLFFYLGLFILLLKYQKVETNKKLVLILLLIAPIPAAITRDPYQVVRAAMMLIPVNLTVVLGFDYFLSRIKTRESKRGIFVLFITLLLLFFVRYFYNYWFLYPTQYSFAWQYGYKQAVNYITEHPEYSKVYFTKKYGETHEFVLFYTKFDPAKYKSNSNLFRYERTNWFWVDSFDKYVFLNDWEIKEKAKCLLNEKCLLVTSPGNSPGGNVVKTIDFLDGTRAFDIVDLSQVQ